MSQVNEMDSSTNTDKRASSSNDNNSSSSSLSSIADPQDQPTLFTPADDGNEAQLNRQNTIDLASESNCSLNINRAVSRILTNLDVIDAQTLKEKDEPLPFGMGQDKEFPPSLPEKSLFEVSYDGPDDPIHPHNWLLKKKLFFCVVLAFNTFMVALSSLVYSPAVTELLYIYGVDVEVTTLGVSLYVLGFASGPVIYAPLSELYGRKPILIMSSFLFICFTFATLTLENIQTNLLCRFFGSFTGSAAMVVVPALFSDVFNNKQRGDAINIFSMCVFLAPLLAPVIGLFITKSYLGWRWTEYIIGIPSLASLILLVLFFEESHHPIILVNKARELRRRTGNWGIYAPQEELSLTFKEIVENNISRPLKLLVSEPIILLISIYNAFIYGILYLFLTAYPIMFQQGYGMVLGVAELPYVAVVIGMLLGGCYSLWAEKKYIKVLEKNNNIPVPEARLPPMIVGAVVFPIGLLWFFWTGNYPDKVHWMAPTASGVFSGFGLITIFLPSLNYIIDSYLVFAASLIAANTFLRSAFGAVFPLFARYMFNGMGLNFAGLLVGLIAVLLIPVPVCFYYYGKKIRTKSKYAFVLQ